MRKIQATILQVNAFTLNVKNCIDFLLFLQILYDLYGYWKETNWFNK